MPSPQPAGADPAAPGQDDSSRHDRVDDLPATDADLADELHESLARLEHYVRQSRTDNTIRAYAADLEDFRHWCERYGRAWLPATTETVGLYLGACAEDLALSTLERRLAAISVLHRDEGYETPASVAEGPLRKVWRGLVREKTRLKDKAEPLLVEDLRQIVEAMPRDEATGELTLASLRDRALLLVGWAGALRRSELVALQTTDLEFVAGEGVNIYIRKGKADQEGAGLIKGIPYGNQSETCPVLALRTWMQAASDALGIVFEGPVFRRFYRGGTVGKTGLTAQYVSRILKEHAARVGLEADDYSAHSLRSGFITQAIRKGKRERRVKEHSGHQSWETFNEYVKRAGTFEENPAKDVGL